MDAGPDSSAPPDKDAGDTDASDERDAAEPDCQPSGDPETVQPAPVYGSSRFLNHYVAADGADLFGASGNSCPTSPAPASVDNCIHAGLLHQFTVTSDLGCSEVRIQDSLGAFEWQCDVPEAGQLRMRSVGLAPGVGIAELVDPAVLAFRPISVSVVTATGCEVLAQSAASEWWNDAFLRVDASATALQALGQQDTVYVVGRASGDPGTGPLPVPPMRLEASGISLVVDPATRAQPKDPTQPVLTTGGLIYAFWWIEGAFEVEAIDLSPIYLESISSRVQKLEVSQTAGTGVSALVCINGSANRIQGVRISSTDQTGLEIHGMGHLVNDVHIDTWSDYALDSADSGSRFSQLRLNGGRLALLGGGQRVHDAHVTVSADNLVGIHVGGSGGHRLDSVRVANGIFGVQVQSDNNWLVSMHVSNASAAGLVFDGIPPRGVNNSTINSLSTSSSDAALHLATGGGHLVTQSSMTASAYGVYVSDVSGAQLLHSVAYNNGEGIHLDAGSQSPVLRDLLVAGTNPVERDLIVEGEGGAFFGQLMLSTTGACTVAGGLVNPGLARTSSVCAGAGSSAVSVSAGHATPMPFAGRLAAQDPSNVSQPATAGLGGPVWDQTAISDWHGFGQPARSFGLAIMGQLPAPALAGACTAAKSCGQWDWTVVAGGAKAFAASYADPVWVRSHTWVAADSTACDGIAGATFGGQCQSTFLQSATERFGDGIGNDNGLCESSEACIVNADLGATLWASDVVLAPQGTVDIGPLTDVEIFQAAQ